MKRKSLLSLWLLAIMLAPLWGFAQTANWGSASDYSGTTEYTFAPWGRHYGWEYRVYCYRPNTLPFGGEITSIAFLSATTNSTVGNNYNSSYNGDSNPMQIWMKEVSGSYSLDASTTFATYVSGATKVYSGVCPAITSGQYTIFNLSTSFAHSQENSLLILVRTVANSTSGCGQRECYYKDLSGGVTLAWAKKQDGSDPGVNASGEVWQNSLPVLQLTYEIPSSCENFNSTTGTSSYSTGGTLPSGWNRIYGGTTETGGTVYNNTATSPANMPHVCTTSAGTPGAPASSNYLCFYSSGSTSTYSYAIMPAVSSGRAASHISFTYKFESTSNGTLTYGAISGTNASTYTVLGTISSPSSNIGTVDVDLDPSQTYGKRIAFRWYKTGTWYTCGIDDICVDYVNAYSLAFNASPSAGGSISVTTNGNNATSGGYYGAGTTFNITATPATGYVFSGWTTSGSAPASMTSATTTLNLTSNTTLTANFSTIATLPYTETFEGSHGWTFANEGCTNQWYVGSPGAHAGSNGLYVSNDNGSSNAYSTGSTSTVYAYKFIELPAGTFNLSYDLRQAGEGSGWDCSAFMLYDATTTPTANPNFGNSGLTNWPTGYSQVISAPAVTSGSWTTISQDFTVATAGVYKLVVGWKNDGGGGSNPPASIDNVKVMNLPPSNLAVESVAATRATLSWTGNSSSYVVGYVNMSSPSTTYNFESNSMPSAFTTTSSYPWATTSSGSPNGSYCAKSTNNGVASSTSDMVLTLNLSAPAVISFSSKISSEASFDKGYFSIDGTVQSDVNGVSGAGSWTSHTYVLTAGTHALRWYYTKDSSVNGNDDCFYVDDIKIFNASTATANSVPFTLTGLTPETDYVAFVRGNDSDWATGYVEFTTGSVYLISNSTAITTCSGTFADSGGLTGNYSNNESYTKTFYPGTSGMMVKMDFVSFATEGDSWDFLEIYDGTSTSATLIGKYGGNSSPGTVVATNSSGALTFYWESDGSNVDTGFEADISCVEPTPVLTISNVTTTTASASWTGSSSSYTFSYAQPVAVADFETGDMTQATFTTTTSSYPWVVTSNSAFSGTYSVKSGNTGVNSSSSDMVLTVNLSQAGSISFAARISSEGCCDDGYFYIDGTAQFDIRGDGSWVKYSYPLSAGSHTLRWLFTKDSSQGPYDDCFYVDDIAVVSGAWTTANTSSTSYNITGLTLGTTYIAKVKGAHSEESSPVIFTTPSTHMITLQQNPSGSGTLTVTNNGSTVTSGSQVNEGAVLNINASPHTGYTFSGWTVSGAGSSVANPNSATTTFTMGTADATLTANFTLNSYQVSVSADPTVGGSVALSPASNPDVIVGTGTGTANTGPFNSGWEISFAETVYTASAINSPAGYIYSLSYYVDHTESGSATSSHVAFYMKHVSRTTMSSYESVSASDLVFDGTWNIPTSGWTTITLDNPFYYDGTSNLMIACHESTAGKAPVFFTYTEVTDARISWGNNSNSINPYNIGTTDGGPWTGNKRVNVKLGRDLGNYYPHGTSVTATATPAANYHFVNWTENGSVVSTSASYTFTVTGARTLTANFTPNPYTITVNAGTGGSASGGGTFNYNTSCTVTATASTGYTFANWTENGSVVSTSASYTFTVTGARTLTANFTPNPYTISASANPSAGGSVSGAGSYNYNTSCTLTATANSGYVFENWTENGSIVSTSATYTFTVTGARTLVANFRLNEFLITVSANPSAGGTVSGGGTYTNGTSCTVSTTVNNGYTFTGWYESNSLVSSNTSYQFTVTAARTLEARFTQNEYTLTLTPNPSAGGSVSASPSGPYHYGDVVTITATANNGYTFASWSDNGAAQHTVTITGNATYTATFTQDEYTLTLNANPSAGGTVSASPSQQTYHYGDVVTITATPNTGYTFTSWSDSGAAQHTVTITGSASYTATFTQITYTVTVTPIPSATYGTANIDNIIGNTSTTVNYGGSVTVYATPATGYVFEGWKISNSGNYISTSSPYTHSNITANLDLTAHFSLTPPAVTTGTTVTNITTGSADVTGSVTYTGGTIYYHGFCWGTSADPVVDNNTNNFINVGTGTGSFSSTIPHSGTTFASNTVYHVRAYAFDGSAYYYGSDVTFTTLAEVATTAVSTYTTTSATLGGSWTAGTGTITGSGVVYSSTNSAPAIGGTGCTQVQSQSPFTTPFTHNVTGLTGNTLYYVRAYAVNAGGTSYGPVVTFTTLDYYPISYLVNPSNAGSVTFSPLGDGTCTSTYYAVIGTTTSPQAVFPIQSYASYSFNEMIYPGDAQDMTEGNITTVSFKLSSTMNNNPCSLGHSIALYLKEVEDATFSGTTPISISDATLCFTGSLPASSATGQWVDIVLDTPFAYDGESNLLVVLVDNSGYASGGATARYWDATQTTGTTCLSYFGGSLIDPANPTSGTSSYTANQRPNAKFTIVASNSDAECYSYGSSTTLTATANAGFYFQNWTENGSVVSTSASYTINNIDAAHTLTANFVDYKIFAYDGNWNDGGNWIPAGAPTISENVRIDADAVITAAYNSTAYVATANTITVNTGSITIEDGGQLQHNNSGVSLTAEKNITGYGSNNAQTNWNYYLFSSPVNNILYSNVTNLVDADHHDLYRFVSNNVESGDLLEWMKVDGTHSSGNLALKEGYIYAKRNTATLSITGTVQPSNDTIMKMLAFNSSYRFGGWNLIGNPFVCNAYVTRSGNDINYYVLNHVQNGTDVYDEFITASSFNDPVAPLSALMVQASTTNQSVTYSRTAPNRGPGILNIDVHKTLERGTALLDRARVRFGEGDGLEKFQFNPNHTKVYIPDGDKDFAVYYAQGAGTIPVNFKAESNGRYTLDFSTEEVNFNYIHLIDNMTGDDVDLLKTPYYAFNAKSTDYASRFTIVFATGENNDDTFAFYNNGVWVINNDGKATLQLIDALGRVLSSETISGSHSKAIDVAPGVYMFRLINGNDVKVQKIVVKR